MSACHCEHLKGAWQSPLKKARLLPFTRRDSFLRRDLGGDVHAGRVAPSINDLITLIKDQDILIEQSGRDLFHMYTFGWAIFEKLSWRRMI